YIESRRVRLNLNVRTPLAGLLAEHRASAPSAERRPRRIVVEMIRVGTLITMRRIRLRQVDRLRRSFDARRSREPFEQPVLLVKQRVSIDAKLVRVFAKTEQLIGKPSIDRR